MQLVLVTGPIKSDSFQQLKKFTSTKYNKGWADYIGKNNLSVILNVKTGIGKENGNWMVGK
jgi:hypothetical protein